MRRRTEVERSAVAYIRNLVGRPARRSTAEHSSSVARSAGGPPSRQSKPALVVHGESIGSTEARHRRRIGVAVNPSGGVSIDDRRRALEVEPAGCRRTSLHAGG
jgi:hypothetical protein